MSDKPTTPANPGLALVGDERKPTTPQQRIDELALTLELEKLAAEKRRALERESLEEMGLVERAARALLGKSWQTSLPGYVGGISAILAVIPLDGLPHGARVALGVVNAICMIIMGRAAKSTKVTGVQ